MPYNACVLRVMIASPSDIDSERVAIRDILYEWNATNSEKHKVVLLPISWETHSAPEMGNSPQEIINRQLQLKDWDLLVGVFGTRIGTPTDKYASGSVEEIEKHIEAKKPAMLYFSSKNGPITDQDQYSELTKLKKSLKNEGLYETYSDLDEFKRKFSRQLQITLNRDFLPQPIKEGSIIDRTLPNISDMSREAQVLLKEASSAENKDNILRRDMIGGFLVRTNDKSFGNSGNPRDRATWEGAIDELEALFLIKATSSKRELFRVTEKGYQVAERITL
jgi:hypothetical protein